jgi:hypothetical protein
VCKCGKGAGSRFDGLCTKCRGGVTAWEAQQAQQGVTCKHCKVTGLRWHPVQRWALLEPTGALHQCKRPTAQEVFANVA